MTDETAVKSAFRTAIKIWHNHVDDEIAAHQGFCTHPECHTDCTLSTCDVDGCIDPKCSGDCEDSHFHAADCTDDDCDGSCTVRNCYADGCTDTDCHADCTDTDCRAGCTRPTTGAEYFTDSRGWDRDTIDRWKLGYAPPDLDVAEMLMDSEHGFSEETVRATGLFTQSEYDDYDLKPLFSARYVFPYFGTDGEPVYAIARTTGSKGGGGAGYDGHHEDFLPGKYAKVAHQQDYCLLDEPFFGLNTLDDDDTVVIAEGIADAITAAEAGHAVLSPVTTEFKRKHFDPLCDRLEEHDVGEVVVLPDSEEASFARIDSDDLPNEPQQFFEAINIPSTPPGLGGALRTANYLCENGIDAFVSQLPRAGLRKVDLEVGTTISMLYSARHASRRRIQSLRLRPHHRTPRHLRQTVELTPTQKTQTRIRTVVVIHRSLVTAMAVHSGSWMSVMSMTISLLAIVGRIRSDTLETVRRILSCMRNRSMMVTQHSSGKITNALKTRASPVARIC